MTSRYLQELKQNSGLTNAQIADRSGVPENTVSNIISGKTVNPGFQIISSIIRAMDGSLDKMAGLTIDDSTPDADSQTGGDRAEQIAKELLALETTMRAEFQQRENDLIAKYERREATLKNEFAAREESIRLDARRREFWLFLLICLLITFVMLVLIIDLLNPTFGYFRYTTSLEGIDGFIRKFCGWRLPYV